MVETMPAAKPVIILTRPAAQNAGFSAALRARDLDAVILESPVTRIVPLPDAPRDHKASDAIFTSRYGVEHGPQGRGVAWCVGDKTAEVAVAKGWDALSAGGDAEALFKRICADLEGKAEGRSLVHYCGQETRGELSARLTNVGISTQRCIVYRQEEQVLTPEVRQALLDTSKAIFPVFSPRSATRLAAQLPPDAAFDFVAISQAAADALPPEMIRRLAIADTPDAQSLIAALRHML